MAIGALIPIIGPAIEKVLSFIPDPEQKARAKAEFNEHLLKEDDSFRNFVIAYEGRGDQVHPLLQFYRGSVRPTATYGFALGLFWAIWTNQPVPVIDMLFKLNLLTLAFWFGSRSLEKMGLSLKGWGKKK
ncbi:MAG: hypothetical protein ACR2Q4_14700 [Geminicoccaceae bacterium]